MPHKSRLGCLVVDCETKDLGEACAFWSAALGMPGKVDEDGKYAQLQAPEDQPRMLLQAVDHPPRVHFDIETDDRAAEVKRLEALGARSISEFPRWTVMEAPTGHRFCVVGPQRPDFADNANDWG